MILSEREKIILNILIRTGDSLSIKEIASLTKIKERTLYREMKLLEESLSLSDIRLIKEKSRYRLEGDIEAINPAHLDLNAEQLYTQDNKINLILVNLLLSEETSIKEISEKLFIAYNTVASAVNHIEKILYDYNIRLIRKKGQGIRLEGSINDKRILLISVISNEIQDDEFYYVINNKDDYTSNPFFKFLDLELMRKVFLENRDLKLFRLYTDSSIKKILIALQVGLNLVSVGKGCKKEYITTTDEKHIREFINVVKKEVEVENEEIFLNFLAKILKTCKLVEQVTYFNDKYSYTIIYKVHRLISNVSAKSGIDFTKDANLATGLIPHIESAVKRHQLKLVESNNELQDFVLKNYDDLYFVIKSEIISIFEDINFSATELSYVVIHFASSYEQLYRESFVRALVVCASGIGSSKILASQIRKNIPEIKNIDYSTPPRLKEDLALDYDIVISTIKLDEDINYVLIPTILRENDIEKIKEELISIKKSKKIEYKNDKNKDINYIDVILKNTKNIVVERVEKLEESLSRILELDKDNLIIKHLIERHKKSSIVVPNTRVALFHTLDTNIEEAYIKIAHLNEALAMDNPLGVREDVDQFFIMISPNDNNYTELLGQISVAILNDEILKKSLDSRDLDYIKTKIELIMTKYKLENKN